MNPATLLLVIQAIQAAISAAPQVLEIAQKGKEFIAALFAHGVITKDQQDAVHAHVDQWVACLNAGIPPAEFKVEADPV